MKRPRVVLNTLTVLSLLLFAATVILWVWSRERPLRVLWSRATGPATWDQGQLEPGTVGYERGTRLTPIDQQTPGLVRMRVRWHREFLGLSASEYETFGSDLPFVPVYVRARSVYVSLWWPLLLSAALPAWWLVGFLRRAPWRADPSRCRKCGYDLRATPDRCPECGAIASNVNSGERKAAP